MDYASSILGFLPGGRRSTGISQLLDKLETYLPPAQVERVREAYEFGAERHHGQKRVSGEPYITHPVAVADILADLRLDADTLVAAILHDVIEDTPTAKAEIASIFGQVVAELVDGVSKLDQIQFKNRQEAQAESFRKMLLAMVRDIRVIMVKLADRMHNMRTLGVMPPVKRRRIARETLEIYAPIAERLGLYAVKLELEDLGFRALYPYRYKVLERELKRARGNQKEFIGKIAETFKGALKKAAIAARRGGPREASCTAFTRRCRTRASRSTKWSMCTAFASSSTTPTPATASWVWCTASTSRCRGASRITSPFRASTAISPCTRRCSDRTACRSRCRSAPSRCTASPNPASPRTGSTNPAATPSAASSTTARANGSRAWCRSRRAAAPRNSSKASRSIFSRTRCTCSPRRARSCACRPARPPVDFAYAIHTDVGNRCVAAKVDRRLVPLRTPLRNGQTVEIITAKGATPNPSWSTFLVTAKARAAIRQYLKNLKRGEALELGKRLLGLALEEFSLSLKKIPAGRHRRGGQGAQSEGRRRAVREDRPGRAACALVVARRLQPARGGGEHSRSSSGPLMIAGTEGLLVTYARCCFPIPNDPIMAYLSAGRGVMIHRQNCGNLAEYRKQPEKWLSVAWEGTHGRLFSSEIQLEINNRVGVLAAVASGIAGTGDQHRSSVAGRARREQLLAQIPAAGARPKAPRARDPHHPQDAGRAAGLPHAGLRPSVAGMSQHGAA